MEQINNSKNVIIYLFKSCVMYVVIITGTPMLDQIIMLAQAFHYFFNDGLFWVGWRKVVRRRPNKS